MSKLFEQISLEADEQPLAEGAGEQAIEDQQIAGEVEAVNAEMQELEVAITTSEDAAEALEQVQEFVEAKQEKGGLTEGEAEAVQVATEALLSRFGGHVKVKHVSLESFGAANGRATATAYTLENIGETVKKIWEAIKKWVKEFIAKAKDWFAAHFSAAGMLKKAGAALAEKARNKIGTVESGEKFTMSGSERKWLSKNAGDTKVSDNIKLLESLVNDVWTDKSIKEVQEVTKNALNALKDVDVDLPADKLKAVFEDQFNTPFTNMLNKIGSQSAAKPAVGSKLVTVGKKELLGAVQLQLRMHSAPNGVLIAAVVELGQDNTTNKFGQEKDIVPLESNDVAAVGDAISMIAEAILSQNKIKSKEDEYVTKAIAQFDKISTQIDKKNKDGKDAGLKEVQGLIKSSAKMLTAAQKSDQTLITYSMTVARAWLSFGKRSLSVISDKKA